MLAVMAVLTTVPVVTAVATGRYARPAVARMRPATATVLLTAFALTAAAATGALLCLVAYVGTAGLLPRLHPDDWSPGALHEVLPVPTPVAVGAGLAAVVLLASAGVHLVRVLLGGRRTAAAAAALPVVGDLVVIDDGALHAYAVPGRVGRVVVSTGLLRQLSAPQRRAVLAHERAHLRHRHYLYAQLVRLAAAANPLLRPVVHAVDLTIERWADAVAVKEVGDAVTVAHALGRVALAQPRLPAPALGAGHDVVERVRDLLEPPRRTARTALVLATSTALCWVSTILVVLYAHGLVELTEVTR